MVVLEGEVVEVISSAKVGGEVAGERVVGDIKLKKGGIEAPLGGEVTREVVVGDDENGEGGEGGKTVR